MARQRAYRDQADRLEAQANNMRTQALVNQDIQRSQQEDANRNALGLAQVNANSGRTSAGAAQANVAAAANRAAETSGKQGIQRYLATLPAMNSANQLSTNAGNFRTRADEAALEDSYTNQANANQLIGAGLQGAMNVAGQWAQGNQYEKYLAALTGAGPNTSAKAQLAPKLPPPVSASQGFGNAPSWLNDINTSFFGDGGMVTSGMVPGEGNEDTVDAKLTPGEVVLSNPELDLIFSRYSPEKAMTSKKAAEDIGRKYSAMILRKLQKHASEMIEQEQGGQDMDMDTDMEMVEAAHNMGMEPSAPVMANDGYYAPVYNQQTASAPSVIRQRIIQMYYKPTENGPFDEPSLTKAGFDGSHQKFADGGVAAPPKKKTFFYDYLVPALETMTDPTGVKQAQAFEDFRAGILQPKISDGFSQYVSDITDPETIPVGGLGGGSAQAMIRMGNQFIPTMVAGAGRSGSVSLAASKVVKDALKTKYGNKWLQELAKKQAENPATFIKKSIDGTMKKGVVHPNTGAPHVTSKFADGGVASDPPTILPDNRYLKTLLDGISREAQGRLTPSQVESWRAAQSRYNDKRMQDYRQPQSGALEGAGPYPWDFVGFPIGIGLKATAKLAPAVANKALTEIEKQAVSRMAAKAMPSVKASGDIGEMAKEYAIKMGLREMAQEVNKKNLEYMMRGANKELDKVGQLAKQFPMHGVNVPAAESVEMAENVAKNLAKYGPNYKDIPLPPQYREAIVKQLLSKFY